jgi:heme/copper-type cytochrome/quinol oxidase subunit 2
MFLTSVLINLCYLPAIKIIPQPRGWGREFYRVISFSARLLLFLLDEVIDPAMTAKALGHQWYWNSNYLDFLDEAIDPAMTTKALGLKLY